LLALHTLTIRRGFGRAAGRDQQEDGQISDGVGDTPWASDSQRAISLTEERLDFVYHFVPAKSREPSAGAGEHEESNAYEEQMKGKRQVRAANERGSDDSEQERDMLAQTA